MKDRCPECFSKVETMNDRYGLIVRCPGCGWFTSWELWDDADNDPDKWKYDRFMEEAEAEATNPNN